MMRNSDFITHHSVFRIGVVNSVYGREVQILVDRDKNTSHLLYKGRLIKNVAVGSYVKILKGFEVLIGKVESEKIEHNKEKVIKSDKQNFERYVSEEDHISRILNLKLIGHLDGNEYVRGIAELPLIDNECHLLTEDEFEKIHSFADKNDVLLDIGTLSTDPLVPIKLGVNKLFASHIGIFGNTGSGKSYTLSKIYRQLFLAFKDNDNFKKKAYFLFYDFNGEYSRPKAIIEGKKVYNLSTSKENGRDKIPLSDKDMLDENLLSIFANATEKTQRPFISRCIKLYDRINKDDNHFRNILKNLLVDILGMSDKVKSELLIDYIISIVPPNIVNGIDKGLKCDFSFHNKLLYYYLGNNTANSLQQYPQLVKNLQIYKQVDKFSFSDNFIQNFIAVMYVQLIYDVLGNRAMNEHIAPAINKLKSNERNIMKVFSFGNQNVDDFWDGKNIVVVNLNDVNTDTKKLIPLLLTNKLYTKYKQKRNRKDNDEYLNIIVDEAHNILSYQSMRESEEWKDYRLEVFEEIIKEGRKFGVFMTIASQRPSDISSTIISQLHNYFIHRLVNDKDIEQVNNTISYLDKVSVESLPILSTGVCVIAGQMTEMPIIAKINRIENENRPQNETIDLIKAWI